MYVKMNINRTLDENPIYSYFISNAMGSTYLKIIELIKGIQLRNHRGYFSQRKRKLLKTHINNYHCRVTVNENRSFSFTANTIIRKIGICQ